MLKGASDGLVNEDSVPLNEADCINYGPYTRDHNELIHIDGSTYSERLYFKDIYYVLTAETIETSISSNYVGDIVNSDYWASSGKSGTPLKTEYLIHNGRDVPIGVKLEITHPNIQYFAVFKDGNEITPQWDGNTWHWVIIEDLTLHPNQWIEKEFKIIYTLPPGSPWACIYFYWLLYEEGNLYSTYYNEIYVWENPP